MMVVTYYNAIVHIADDILKNSRDAEDADISAYVNGAINTISFVYSVRVKRVQADVKNAMNILNESAEH